LKVLVTGAPGWLGSRLVQGIYGGVEGAAGPSAPEVRCLVGPGMDSKLIEALGAEPVSGDITVPATLDKALEGIELVFHLAGLIHPKRIPELFAINTDGTRNLLAAAERAGVKRFVYVSSNSVGGTNLRRDKLMTEDEPPRPYMAYGRSKLLAEQAVHETQAAGKMETVIVRPCWFYGPGQPPRQTRFFKMIKSGKPLIFGNGQNLRSMSYVDNTVQGLLLAATSDRAVGETYWLADERPYETLEIYGTVAGLLGVERFSPRRIPGLSSTVFALADRVFQSFGLYQMEFHVAGEMNQNIACSVEKAKQELGYAPPVALEEGMRRSLEWCEAQGIVI
jgi:nucleoside-diphosphate-sugar epimerase